MCSDLNAIRKVEKDGDFRSGHILQSLNLTAAWLSNKPVVNVSSSVLHRTGQCCFL